MTQFSGQVGTNVSRVSRIVGGWEYPSEALARSMANTLKMSTDEFEKLL
jgi:hypothetical protein